MIIGLDIKIDRIFFTGLCVLIFIVIGTMNGIGQGVSYGTSEETESQAHTYCVQMGFTYVMTPTLNNGQPVCKFPDGNWCDANAFYNGQCAASYNPAGLPNPYATYYGYTDTGSVHTPYGDVPLNMAYNNGNIYVRNPYTGGWADPYWSGSSSESAQQAAWMYGAVSFLNSP